MKSAKHCYWHAVAAALLLFVLPERLGSQPSGAAAVRIDSDDIGGAVTGANGPEAGVWVIAETTDLPTKYTKPKVVKFQLRPDPLAK